MQGQALIPSCGRPEGSARIEELPEVIELLGGGGIRRHLLAQGLIALAYALVRGAPIIARELEQSVPQLKRLSLKERLGLF